MAALTLRVVFILTYLKVINSDVYVPGTPGARWTEEYAEVIRDKLFYLWDNKAEIIHQFDFNNTEAPVSHTKYVYDPSRRLSTVDCNWNQPLCQVYWRWKRFRNIAFSEAKAISLLRVFRVTTIFLNSPYNNGF